MCVRFVIGCPGSGKTTRLIHLIEDYLSKGGVPEMIGFVTFSRAAKEEALDRIVQRFNIPADRFPNIRTLHSMGTRMLGLSSHNILGENDWELIQQQLGLQGYKHKNEFINIEDRPTNPADIAMQLISTAQIKVLSLRDVYDKSLSWLKNEVSYEQVRSMYNELEAYKRRYDKVTYNDIIQRWAHSKKFPELDILLVDEAQDLSSLQWTCVRKLAANAREVYVAGDDDQAIYQWAGADVTQFIAHAKHHENIILDQSNRLPAVMVRMSNSFAERLGNRVEKRMKPVREGGRVQVVGSPWDVDFGTSADWLVMARTLRTLESVKEKLYNDGVFFREYKVLHESVHEKTLRAISTWEELRNGQYCPLPELINLTTLLRKNVYIAHGRQAMLESKDPNLSMNFNQFKEILLLEMETPAPWPSVLSKSMSINELTYYQKCERKGYDLKNPAPVVLSSIHRAKGREAENVLLMTDTASASSTTRLPRLSDAERRTFYVGMTRAKSSMVLCQKQKNTSFDLVPEMIGR